MLGSSALTLWQTENCRMALLHALGHVCKFVLRCKNLYRIGPRCNKWDILHVFQGLTFNSETEAPHRVDKLL